MTLASTDPTTPLRQTGVVILCLCALLLLMPAGARAAHHAGSKLAAADGTVTTITFDDQPDNTALSDQYAPGVTFIKGGALPGYNGCCFPVVRASSQAHSGPNTASLFAQCRPEFCTPGVAGRLGAFASFIRVYMGSIQAQGSNSPVTLTAYDSNFKQIGQQTAPLPASVSTPLEVDAPSQEIAYFTVQTDGSNLPVAIDDLSFDVPAAPPPPDFQLGVTGTVGIYAAPGAGGSEPIEIQRFNGSTGSIQFQATDLPSGWTASFDPNPASQSDASTKLTITPAPGAQSGSVTNVTIEADPSSSAGATPRQLKVPVNVEQPMGLQSATPTLPDCQSSTTLNVYTQPSWHQPVDVSVISPSGDSVSPSRITPDGNFYHPIALNVGGTGKVVLRLTSGSYSVDVPLTVESNLSIRTIPGGARSYGDNRDVLITGTGFCAAARVQIGAQSVADASSPDWVSPDGTRMTIPVSPLATPGSVVVSAGAASVTSSGTMFVDSYRNTNGFSFHNYIPHITFDQLTQAFGHDQTYDCLGIDACFRDPWAIIVSAIADTAFDGSGGGACFGFSLGSLRIYSGSLEFAQGKLVDQFPHAGGADVFGIDPAVAAGGTDGPINDYINAMQASQLSDEFLGHYLSDVISHIGKGGAASAQGVYGEVKDSLGSANADFPNGTYPLIALRDGGSGHVVVAYGIEGTPSDYYIDVYDSNRPFTGDENSNGATHGTNVTQSRIHVDSDGHWQLPSSGMVGDMAGLVVTRPTDLPKFNPTMIGTGLVEKGAAAILFASAGSPQSGSGATASRASKVTQLTDGAGHTMFAANGSLNADPATRLAAAPFAPLTGGPGGRADASAPFLLVPAGETTLHETVSDTGTGADSHMLVDNGTVAEVDTNATAGARDQLTLTPGSPSLGFSTDAARKPVALTVMDRSASRLESATVTTTSSHGGADSVSLAHGLVIQHRGPATTLTIKLTATGPGTVPEAFQSAAVRVPSNGTARIRRIGWGSLGGPLRLTVGGRTRLLRNRLGRLSPLKIRSLRARGLAGHGTALTVRLARQPEPPGTQVSIQWVVRRGATIVATHTVLAGQHRRSVSYAFTPAGPGTYTATATAMPLRTTGITQQAARPSTRSVAFTS